LGDEEVEIFYPYYYYYLFGSETHAFYDDLEYCLENFMSIFPKLGKYLWEHSVELQ
jgi:hypothetical protein